jgi:hypothetical protein
LPARNVWYNVWTVFLDSVHPLPWRDLDAADWKHVSCPMRRLGVHRRLLLPRHWRHEALPGRDVLPIRRPVNVCQLQRHLLPTWVVLCIGVSPIMCGRLLQPVLRAVELLCVPRRDVPQAEWGCVVGYLHGWELHAGVLLPWQHVIDTAAWNLPLPGRYFHVYIRPTHCGVLRG